MGNSKDHAVLSPSAASRWMTCTPSARFEEEFPDVQSEFAAEGTLAHALAELILKNRLKPMEQFELHLEACMQHELYTEEMLVHCEQYADYCLSEVVEDSHVAVETWLDISAYAPESFGTGDFLVYTPSLKRLVFRDLKYGKGVPVSAINNSQLKLYALGAYEWFRWVYGDDVEIETISVGIYQPRINNNSEWEISLNDLLKWAVEELMPAAEKAFRGEGEFVVGDHCKFCKARVRCQALADHNLDLFKHELKAHDQLKDSDLVEIVKKIPLLISWANDIGEYMLAEAIKGKKWDGMKLVEGKSNRVFVSESETEKTLLAAGVEKEKIYEPQSLLGISKLERSLGAKLFRELVQPGLRKPAGKPTLVDAADPRPDFDRAQAVFKDVEIKEAIE